MSSNHFSYFRVKNFKRFKDLEVKGIGQFNLVLGDNNVGKTSFLEALLCLNDDRLDPENHTLFLYKTLFFKNLHHLKNDMWNYYRPKGKGVLESKDRIEFVTKVDGKGNAYGFDIIPKVGNQIQYEYFLLMGDKKIIQEDRQRGAIPINLDSYSVGSIDVPFVPLLNYFDNQITDLYFKFIQGNKKLKASYIQALSKIIPNIVGLEPTFLEGDIRTLLIAESNSDHLISISHYGDGVIKLAKIFSNLIRYKTWPLMIDEIDAGIHYSRMKDYWKVILQSAKENDVQIFATTHNRECIQYFVEALEELGEEYKDKARAINLVENQKTKEVKSVTSTFSELEHGFLAGNELR